MSGAASTAGESRDVEADALPASPPLPLPPPSAAQAAATADTAKRAAAGAREPPAPRRGSAGVASLHECAPADSAAAAFGAARRCRAARCRRRQGACARAARRCGAVAGGAGPPARCVVARGGGHGQAGGRERKVNGEGAVAPGQHPALLLQEVAKAFVPAEGVQHALPRGRELHALARRVAGEDRRRRVRGEGWQGVAKRNKRKESLLFVVI